MAVFSINSIGNIDDNSDLKKVKSYLYKLSDELNYMFNNLNPEDNYSETARVTYLEQGEKIGQLEVSVDGISATVQDTQKNYKSSMQVLANLLSLSVETPDESSSVVLTGDKITLSTGKFVINSTNITVDEAGNATFSGKVRAASISGSYFDGGEITVGVFNANDDGCTLGDWEVVGENTSVLRSSNRKISFFGESGSITTGGGAASGGSMMAGDTIRTGEIYLTGDWHAGWSLTRELKWLDERITDLEDA